MSTQNSITCPNCGNEINVNDILYHQIEKKLNQDFIKKQKEFENETNQKREEYTKYINQAKSKQEELDKTLENAKNDIQNEVQKGISKALKDQTPLMREEIKKQLDSENQEAFELLKKQLSEKSEQIKQINLVKIENENLKREKDEIQSKIQAESEKKLNEILALEREKIAKNADEKNELQLKQKDEQLEMLNKQISELKRKIDQGSQQLQGETQELAIEEFLKNKFPFDCIEEIKKGTPGGDCMQIVHTRELQNCGKIYYESKRTKEFQRSWIEKFKADMREKSADIGVIVTQSMPKDLDRMGLYDGIWVCSFEEFKGLCGVLREGIISISLAKKSQENKTDKMNLLYNYLTSNEFVMQVEAIIEGFNKLKSELDKEKKYFTNAWKIREKQLEKVLYNTINMHGSIKGIAGESIASVKALEYDQIELLGEIDDN